MLRRLPSPIFLGQSAGCLERSPSIRRNAREEIVDAIPPEAGRRSGCRRDGEYGDRDFFAANELLEFCMQRGIRIVERDRDESRCGATREVTTSEFAEWNEGAQTTRGSNERAEGVQRDVSRALSRCLLGGDTVKTKNSAPDYDRLSAT